METGNVMSDVQAHDQASVTREECEAAFDESLGNIHATALTLQMHGQTEMAPSTGP